jgi:paraquat-inducible protein B
MNKEAVAGASAIPLARVTVRAKSRAYNLVWLVPALAALFAGYLVYERVQEFGPAITVTFKDGDGLRAGLTPVKYRGVSIGKVVAVGLSNDHQHVLATVRLQHAMAAMADEGAMFWIVRPEVGLGSISGLSTVMTGPEIQMLPGSGQARSAFVGLEDAPAQPDHKGLGIILHCARLGSIRAHTPLLYRGIEVGTVTNAQLSPDAMGVEIQVFVPQRFAPLIQSGSKFWKISSAAISGGLFRGLEFKLESLSTLVTGGIEFATPESAGAAPAAKATNFLLYDRPEKEWIEWSARIPIRQDQQRGTG